MGWLILPASGTVYVDTQIVIYTVERHPVYRPLLEPLWRAAQAGTIQVISSELTLLECMVLPIRAGDIALQHAYEQALMRTELRLVEISQSVLLEAAKLRATTPTIRTPDAIHGATARLHHCQLVVTNDVDLRKVPGLSITVLKDLAAAP